MKFSMDVSEGIIADVLKNEVMATDNELLMVLLANSRVLTFPSYYICRPKCELWQLLLFQNMATATVSRSAPASRLVSYNRVLLVGRWDLVRMISTLTNDRVVGMDFVEHLMGDGIIFPDKKCKFC